MQNIINFNLQEQPRDQDDLLEIVAKIFKYSIKTGHPYFMNQLFSGWDIDKRMNFDIIKWFDEILIKFMIERFFNYIPD